MITDVSCPGLKHLGFTPLSSKMMKCPNKNSIALLSKEKADSYSAHELGIQRICNFYTAIPLMQFQ